MPKIWKHRILLVLHEDGNEITVPMYYSTLEQAGMITYMLRRCLLHKHFEIVHNVYNKTSGYVTIGETYEVRYSDDEVAKLRDNRMSRSNYCIEISKCEDIHGNMVENLQMYAMDILDVQIIDALLAKGLLGVRTVLTLLKRDNVKNWAEINRYCFSPIE